MYVYMYVCMYVYMYTDIVEQELIVFLFKELKTDVQIYHEEPRT